MGIVFVTGTSTGIGMASAISLARAGHTIYAGMRNPQRLGELHEAIARENLGIRIVAHDVDGDASARDAIEQALAEAGRIASSPQAPYASSKWALEALSECMAQEVRGFGIRVAIVEPGVIATAIFGKVGADLAGTHYPHKRRINELFRASLEKPVSPFVVGDKIRDIIDSGTWTLRHPVGPHAAGFLQWRASLTDEQWVEWGALSDEEWVAYVRSTFGLNVSL